MQGAFGSIHPAQDVETGELWVMKVIYLTANAKRGKMSAEDIAREYAMLTRVGSPLAPKNLGIVDHKTYAIQKAYTGDMLDLGLLLVNAPLRGPILLKTFVDIIADLERIHRAGIIHLDLKPENMLYAPHRPMALCDFGLCQDVSSRRARVIKGTHGYLAPEMILGKGYDTPLDMFSLALSMIYLHSPNMEMCPFYSATDKQRMTVACKTLKEWRQSRSPTGSAHGTLNWKAIHRSHEPLDVLAKDMFKLNPTMAKIVFENLLEEDPEHRFGAAQILPEARTAYATVASLEPEMAETMARLGHASNKTQAAIRALQERTADKQTAKAVNGPQW